jgi:hypothetical protein
MGVTELSSGPPTVGLLAEGPASHITGGSGGVSRHHGQLWPQSHSKVPAEPLGFFMPWGLHAILGK